jgi:hypothetical protein
MRTFSTAGESGRQLKWLMLLSACVCMAVFVGCGDAPKPTPPKKAVVGGTNDMSTNAVVYETKSVFEDDPKTAKDPFFPSSTRLAKKIAPGGKAIPTMQSLIDLHLRGIIGSPGKYIAMINDKTFAVGDKSQVLVGPNQSLVVKVLKMSAKTVTVSVDGEASPRDLTMSAVTQEAKK